jgi:hypothetical protein
MPMPNDRSFVRRGAGALAVLLLVLAATSASRGDPPDSSKAKVNTSITPEHGVAPPGFSSRPPKEFHPIPLPDSLETDVHTAWRLRARVGKAFWPAWAAHSPAPLVVRGNPFDFFVLHPEPPSTTTPPKVMQQGGYYYVSLLRLPAPPARDTRIEESNRWWCVSYDIEGGRGAGPRSAITTMLATRDFMVFETMTWKPQWADFAQMDKIMELRTNRDLVAWLDTEAVALRAAILANDPKFRTAQAKNAIRARGMADAIAQHDLKLMDALGWYEAAARSEGSARYMGLLLQDESRSVVSGDTAYALPEQGGEFAFRAKVWRAHLAAGTDKDVKGVNLATVREVGAMYCVLLDASQSGWQTAFLDPANRTIDLLQKALTGKRNSKVFAG